MPSRACLWIEIRQAVCSRLSESQNSLLCRALTRPLAATLQDVFFSALEFAGTYGVLVLFGLIPVAMVWSERYAGTTLSRIQVVPGGKPVLVLTAAVAGGVIVHELFTSVAQLAG